MVPKINGYSICDQILFVAVASSDLLLGGICEILGISASEKLRSPNKAGVMHCKVAQTR